MVQRLKSTNQTNGVKYVILATLVFALTQCAPTNPIKIAGYDVSSEDEIQYTEIPCFNPRIIHGSDTFDERRILDAYKLDNRQGYLIRFKDRKEEGVKNSERNTYVVELDSACQVMRVNTVLPIDDK